MNKSLRCLFGCFVAALLFASGVSSAPAQTRPSDLCEPKGVIFGFFNGVLTTQAEADRAMAEFRIIHGVISSSGDPIGYEVFYNYTNGLDDLVETFEQRLSEQDGLLVGRFELFFDSLGGAGTWWTNIPLRSAQPHHSCRQS